MLVERLRCTNFRNIENIEIRPCNEINVICGENAQGKTNIIEALWLFTGAKSFRNAKDSSFVKFEKTASKNEIDFLFGEIKNSAGMLFEQKRTAFLNEKALNNPSQLAGNFYAVVFTPDDLSLVKDGPAQRRKFLDVSIGQLYPKYIEIIRSYTRAVIQRNQTIKDYRYDASLSIMLDVFENEISSLGEKITEYRKKYIKLIEKYISEIYSGLSGEREKIKIKYIFEEENKSLSALLFERRKEDVLSGVTSVGPHRHDIGFFINDIPARGYASQGQKRSVALSLKLSQAQVIKEIVGEYPICLLDDVMSELDPIRQNYILNHIKGWQSFITCCDPDNTKGLREGKIFTVKNGGII